jgi:hypothetical protein
VQFAFEPVEVVLIRLVGQYLAVAEVQQLQTARDSAGRPMHNECVEPQLEHRLLLPLLARGATGLVVHDTQAAISFIHAVDVPAQQQVRIEGDLDELFAVGRLDPARILEDEVPVEQHSRVGEQLVRCRLGDRGRFVGRPVGILDERERCLRFVLEQVAEGQREDPAGLVDCALRSGQVVETVEHFVDEGSAERGKTWPLGQSVDRAEPVEQPATEEVPGPARRQGAHDRMSGGAAHLAGAHAVTHRFVGFGQGFTHPFTVRPGSDIPGLSTSACRISPGSPTGCSHPLRTARRAVCRRGR